MIRIVAAVACAAMSGSLLPPAIARSRPPRRLGIRASTARRAKFGGDDPALIAPQGAVEESRRLPMVRLNSFLTISGFA